MKVLQIGGQYYDSNIYFIDCSQPLLIDAGTGTNERTVIARARELLDGRALARIILTHGHFDHTGGAAGLKQAFEAEVYIHDEDAGALRTGDSMLSGAFLFGSKLKKCEVKTLGEGDRIELGEGSLEVLHTPGHSAGSISLFHAPTGSLFCGDAVFTNGGVGRWDLPGGDRKTLVASLKKLSTLGVKNLYTGHGPFAEGDGAVHIKWGLESIAGCPDW